MSNYAAGDGWLAAGKTSGKVVNWTVINNTSALSDYVIQL